LHGRARLRSGQRTAMLGAWLLALADQVPAIARYSVAGAVFETTPIKLIIGGLIVTIALFTTRLLPVRFSASDFVGK